MKIHCTVCVGGDVWFHSLPYSWLRGIHIPGLGSCQRSLLGLIVVYKKHSWASLVRQALCKWWVEICWPCAAGLIIGREGKWSGLSCELTADGWSQTSPVSARTEDLEAITRRQVSPPAPSAPPPPLPPHTHTHSSSNFAALIYSSDHPGCFFPALGGFLHGTRG